MNLRPFGGTGRQVSCVGLGGEGVLRTHGRGEEARAAVGRDPERLPRREQEDLLDRFRPYAQRLAYYRGVL